MIEVSIDKKLYYFNLKANFTINNEVLALQGLSGSGKTTILNCIAGLTSPDQGNIKINNKVLFSSYEKINLPIRDRNIGYVFQNYALFPHMSVKENILFGLKERKNEDLDDIGYITKVFKIEHLMDRLPNQISGGEKQRVALARALAAKPKLLLLDEPFTALDQSTKGIVYQEFLQFKKTWNISMILVTHDPNESKLLADKIIHIKDGICMDKK